MEKIPEVIKVSAHGVTTNVTIDQFKASMARVSLHLIWINEIAVR
jgi:hypothetical protein